MLIEDYFSLVDQWIGQTGYVVSVAVTKEKRSEYVGFIKGVIEFADGSSLHVMEFVDVRDTVDRFKYRYHYQDQRSHLIFRYDMAPHGYGVATAPHHKHIRSSDSPDQVVDSSAPLLSEVLVEIQEMLTP